MDKITEQMAIEIHIEECKNRMDRIKEFMENNSNANTSKCCKNIRVLEKSIQALEEIQQYEAIGTVQQCKEAVAKQKPEKPYHIELDEPLCPYCHGIIEYGDTICECGQRLDWI